MTMEEKQQARRAVATLCRNDTVLQLLASYARLATGPSGSMILPSDRQRAEEIRDGILKRCPEPAASKASFLNVAEFAGTVSRLAHEYGFSDRVQYVLQLVERGNIFQADYVGTHFRVEGDELRRHKDNLEALAREKLEAARQNVKDYKAEQKEPAAQTEQEKAVEKMRAMDSESLLAEFQHTIWIAEHEAARDELLRRMKKGSDNG